ncbi:LamG-like jellyroll fold domain-containing protein [Nonomuraea ceibae]|uniref:LamG-like jellyroll fold domain-containing protein n=1 Tax=Nonomuraea ceibae TaxID=1935170 RepID=UPI001C60737D|nr:LamG-like jellyroll fold domain-containing protein [Nonomuraea ceibae]
MEAVYTEASRTWAYPDGHLSTESYAGPTQLKQGDGSWAWLDTQLVEQDGVLKPKVAKANVTFSLGGAAPFASMERDKGQKFALTWPTPLPKPTITGNVAEYRDAAGPKADLVVTALPTGFRHDVVLRERPKGPVEFRIPVETRGLTFAEKKQGGLRLSDAKGKVVAEAPEPVMWDNSDQVQQKPGGVQRRATIPTQVIEEDGQSVLVLKPDPAWLADPATTFPVVVDPTSTLTVKTDTLLSSLCGYGDQPGSTVLKIGGQRASCNGTDGFDYFRSYLKFDVSTFKGKPIHSAAMQLFKSRHLACHVPGVGSAQGMIYAGRVQHSWTPGRMTWSNKPANTLEPTGSLCSSAATQTMSWPVTNWVKRWAGGAANDGIELRGTSEDLVNSWDSYWAEFHSAEMTGTGATPPKLIVQYFLPPEIPTVTAESVDSLDGEHAIVRDKSVKVGYSSRSVDGRNLDYYLSVIESTAPLPSWTTGAGATGEWSFNEGTGGLDSSGRGHDLIFTSGTYSEVAGKQGKAILLNGGPTKSALASAEAPALTTDKDFSLAGWVKLDTLANSVALLNQNGTRNSAVEVGFDYLTKKWYMRMHHDDSASAATTVTSTPAAQSGVWTHLAGTFDADSKKMRLYVNGAPSGEDAFAGTPWASTGAFNLNGSNLYGGASGSSTKANFDEVRVYDRTLSETELSWMTSLTPPTNANLPSGQAASVTYDVSNVDSFKISVRACLNGINPPSCNESPYYRITTDSPLLPTDTETGMADPTQPILSGMVNRPSGGPVTAKYYLYDNTGAPVGSVPIGTRTLDGGQRASFQLPPDLVQMGTTYTWQMAACASGENGEGEICTSKTSPASFATPGTPPPPPEEDIRHLTLNKDNFIIKSVKTAPAACDGRPCMVVDDTSIRVGGNAIGKTVAAIGFRLDELPDGAAVSEGILRLGTPTCATGLCPADGIIKAAPLKSPVTSESTGPGLEADVEPASTPYSLSLDNAQADIAGSEYQWLLLTSDMAEVVSFGEDSAAQQPTLALRYIHPGPPSGVLNLVTQAGDTGAVASWGLPERTGSLAMLDAYDVEVSDAAGTVVKTFDVTDPYAAITNLTNGQTYTVRVRAKTHYGVSAWEAATVTPLPIPPPPAEDAPNPCVLEWNQPQSTAAAESGAQEYIDRVMAYYRAQDQVLEGTSEDIWGTSSGRASSPLAASLSLTNASLIRERAVTEADGASRTNSALALRDVVVQRLSDGQVGVMANVDRSWSTSARSSQPRSQTRIEADQVEGSAYTLAVHVFDRCGGMSIIQVPIDFNLDTTDFYDPTVICGSLPPQGVTRATTGEWPNYCKEEGSTSSYPSECTRNGNRFSGEHSCKHAMVSKFWWVKLEMGADWETADDYYDQPGSGGYPHRWSATRHTAYMSLFPIQGEKFNSDWGKTLRTHASMKVEDITCFGLAETQYSHSAGLTASGSAEPAKVGGSLQVAAQVNWSKTEREQCSKFKYAPTDFVNNPKIARQRARVEGRCVSLDISVCNLKQYHREVIGNITFKKGIVPPPKWDNLSLSLTCDYRRAKDSAGVLVQCVNGCTRDATEPPWSND